MSTPPDKPPPTVAWKTIERVASEAEVDALADASDAEIDAQLAKAGFAPDDAAAVLEGALAKAGDPPPARAVEQTPPRIVVSGAVDKRRPAPPPRRPSTRAWVLVAAAAVLFGLLVWKRDEVVAWLAPHDGEIRPTAPPVDESPSPKQRAAELRKKALAACDAMSWYACAAGLDAARDLDPPGDLDPRVRRRASGCSTRSAPSTAGPRRTSE